MLTLFIQATAMPPSMSLTLDEEFSIQEIGVKIKDAPLISLQGFIHSALVRQRVLQKDYRKAVFRSIDGKPDIGFSESLAQQKEQEIRDVQDVLCKAQHSDREALIYIAKNLVRQNAIIPKLINFENSRNNDAMTTL